MGTTVDSLEIQLQMQSQKASSSIDTLIDKLGTLNTSLTKINGSGLSGVANGVDKLSRSMNGLKNVGAADYTRLAKGIEKISNLDSGQISKAATAIIGFGKGLQSLNSVNVSKTSEQVAALANGIKQLGYTSSGKAIENIPKLASAMRQLMSELSKAPKVSQNLIDMTNALAKLSRTGAASGRAANALGVGLNNYTKSTHNASRGTKGLASALGKMYATYWLLFRAIGKIGDSITIASDLVEVQNVVDTVFGNMSSKVEEFAQKSIEQFGMSELSFKQYASRFQAMGAAMGIDTSSIESANSFLNKATGGYVSLSDSMADVSLTLTQLTADMASFYNVSQKDVAEDLAAIFTGETRPLRTYGLDLTQATLAEWAMKQGLDANIQSMSQAEKTMLRYRYVLANTTAAQGDFARTANTWANQIRILQEQVKKFASVIGTGFIAAFKPFLQTLNTVMAKVIDFTQNVLNALGQIFGWEFEISGGGITNDMGDVSGSIGDSAGNAGDLSDNLGNAVENAKKLRTITLGIDELNINAPQDEKIPSGGTTGGGTGGSGTGGSGTTGSGLTTTIKRNDKLLEAYKSNIKTLEQLGDYIGTTLTNAMNRIDWKKVYSGAKNFGKGLADFLNGLISPELFGATGRTIANSLNTAIYAALSFGEEFDFYEFGESIAEGINEFFKNFDFKSLAGAINTFAKGILDTIIVSIEKTNWKLIGKKIGKFLAEIDFIAIAKKLAKALWKAINKAIETYANIFSEAPIETALLSIQVIPKLLKAITDSKYVTGIRNLFSSFKRLSDGLKLSVYGLSGNRTAIAELSKEFPKFSEVVYVARRAFENFRFGIENGNFITGLSEGIRTVRDNLTKMQKAIIGVTSVFAEFSLIKDAFYDIASGSDNLAISIGKVTTGAGIATAALKLIGVTTPWTLAITGAVGLTSAVLGVNKAYSEQAQIERYGTLLSNITSEVNKNSEAIKKRAEESRKLVEDAGVAEAAMASDLANKYFNLAEKENLTNVEKEQMKNLAKTLVNTLPGLEEYYNTETGLLDASKEAIDRLIKARLQQIRLSALEDQLKEAYKQQAEAIEEVEKALEPANIAQDHMNKLQKRYEELSEKLEAVEEYKKLSEEIDSCEGDTSKLVERQKELWDLITNKGKEEFPTFENLSAKVAQSETDIKAFQTEYEEIMGTLANAEEAYSAVETNISDLTTMLTNGMTQAAEDSVSGYNKGISENKESSKTETKSWIQGVIDKARELLDSHSPSRVFKSLGNDSVNGYNKGISEKTPESEREASTFIDKIVKKITNGMTPIETILPNSFSLAWADIKTVFSPITNWFGEKWRNTKDKFRDTQEFFRTKFNSGYNEVKTAFNPMNAWFQGKWDSTKGNFSDTKLFFGNKFQSGYTATTNAFSPMATWFKRIWVATKSVFGDVSSFFRDGFQSAYNAVTRIWSGIKGFFAKIGNWIIDPIQRAVNGVIDGINWVFDTVSGKRPLSRWTNYPRFATGSNGLPSDTIGVVNDQSGSTYKELIVPPHGKPFIPEGRNVMLPMEKGTKIMPAGQTKALMNGMPKFKRGIGDFFGGMWEKVSNFTGDVLDYIIHPSKIVQIAIDKFTDLSNVGSFFIPLATGAVNKLFDTVVGFVSRMFDNVGGAEKAVKWAIGIANDNSHGYDQNSRWGYPDYDCSSLVITAFEKAGIKMKSAGATYTGNMYNIAKSIGFADVTSGVNLGTGTGLKRGDILLNRENHTALYIGNGKVVQASSNEFGGIKGGLPGDQTGQEINVSSYYNYPWNDVLRFVKRYKDGIGKISIADLIPQYSVGGFPEDGLFMANHNELVGQFSDGRTAVANNLDIQKGIEDAAYRGFSRANAENREQENLLRELLQAVRDGKEIRIDGRTLVSITDSRRARNGYSFT